MPEKFAKWLFDPNATDEPNQATTRVTEAVIAKLEELACEAERASGMQVLNEAPGLYEGPVNEQAALALTYEACGTWLWGQLHGGPDRGALLDVMSN